VGPTRLLPADRLLKFGAPRLPLHVIQRCLCKQCCSISLMTTYCTEIRSMKTLEAHALYFLRFFCETDCGRYNALSTCYATLLPKSNFASTPCVCVRACVRACALLTNDCLVHTGRSQVAVLDNSAASKVAVLRGLSTMFWQTQLFFSLIWPGVTTDNPGVL
jgi:hypothetical protein